MIDKIKKVLRNPYKIFLACSNMKVFRLLPDKMFLKIMYRGYLGKKLNLDNPVLFNEKIQWLKLYDFKPKYTLLVDKHEVKKYIANLLGERYVIPTIGSWDKFEEINFDELPDQFVLKCTHDSGGVVVCRDKKIFDKKMAERIIKKSLRRNYYYFGREKPYKDVPHRIICEKYVADLNGELKDYKFFCFNGKIDCIMVVADREKNDAKFYYMDKEWNILPYGRLTRSLPKDFVVSKPDGLREMIEIAEKLSEGFLHVRIDLYNVDGCIYFGEYTFYSQSGFEDGFDYESDKHLGDLIVLPDAPLE